MYMTCGGVTRFARNYKSLRTCCIHIARMQYRVPSHRRSTIKLPPTRIELARCAAAAAPSLLIIHTSQHKSQLRATTTRKCTRRNDDDGGGVLEKKARTYLYFPRARMGRRRACAYIGPTNDDSVLRQLIITTHTHACRI